MSLTATWSVKHADPGAVAQLARDVGVSETTATCLLHRGVDDPKVAESFLAPRLSALQPPSQLADLEKAAERFVDAVAAGERIGVFGDYDVDGVSSAALITLLIKKLGAHMVTIVADRFAGYGMDVGVVDKFKDASCGLIVAVDCGTSDHAAVDAATRAGIDVIILDHHRVEGKHPGAYAFVNPEREDSGFNETSHAAVGIAFYFAAAVRSVLSARGHVKREDLDLVGFLDLVALGSVADVMPLVGNNRILVSHGLAQMSKSPREGIKSLLRIARIRSPKLRADHIAYQLAPRLNAAGRIGSAKEAFDLLVADNRDDASALSSRLDELSKQRRGLEEKVVEAAKEMIAARGTDESRVIVVAGEGWHKGVLGIVASRLVDWTGKPAYVAGFDGEKGSGSARSPGQLDLHESLVYAGESLERFGGHRDAAGFSLLQANLDRFKELLEEYAAANWVDIQSREMVCDARLLPQEITPGLLREISRIGPFGTKNEEPVFDIDGLFVLDKRIVGGDHLKLHLKTPSGSIGAFGPRMGDCVDEIPTLIRVAASITADEWRGDGTPELRLVARPVPGE